MSTTHVDCLMVAADVGQAELVSRAQGGLRSGDCGPGHVGGGGATGHTLKGSVGALASRHREAESMRQGLWCQRDNTPTWTTVIYPEVGTVDTLGSVATWRVWRIETGGSVSVSNSQS